MLEEIIDKPYCNKMNFLDFRTISGEFFEEAILHSDALTSNKVKKKMQTKLVYV